MSIAGNLRGVIMSHEQKSGPSEEMSEEYFAGSANTLSFQIRKKLTKRLLAG